MDWISKLMSLPKYGTGIGLHRMAHLCRDIQDTDWWHALKPINIVGTNGKGSTTAMVTNILEALGFVTGQYTSPHLIDFSERIQVGGRPIEKQDLSRLIDSFFAQKKNYEAAFPNDHIGAFEAFTSIALHYFYEKKPDVVVLEAGIGGRYDPTRICSGNILGLTSLDLEHTQLLGDTLEEIAMDKMDLVGAGAKVLLGAIPAEVKRKLEAYAKVKGVELIAVQENSVIHNVRYESGAMIVSFSIDGLAFDEIECPLLGPHQLNNLLLAVLLVKEWLQTQKLGIEKQQFVKAIKLALKKLRWPGRFEKVHDRPAVYVDVGHTPQAMHQLALTVKQVIQSPLILVFGLSKGRDPLSMLSPWLPIAPEVYLTQACHRSQEVEVISAALKDIRGQIKWEKQEKMEKVLEQVMEKAELEGKVVLVSGSMFLAVEAKAYLQGIAPGSLRFF